MTNGTGTLPAGGTIFDVGDAGDGVIIKQSNNSVGFFTFTNRNYIELHNTTFGATVGNMLFGRNGVSSGVAFSVINSSSNVAVLAQHNLNGGSSTIGTVSFATNEDWRVEGIRAGNTHFFLRRNTTLTTGNVFVAVPGSTPSSLIPLTAASGPAAREPLTVIDNGTISKVAFLSQGAVNQQISFQDFNGVSTSGGLVNFTVPTGTTLTDLTWIDSRFLVARSASSSTPNVHKLVRIDRNNQTLPFSDLSLNVNVRSLKRSGDGKWLAFIVDHIVAGTSERSAAVMHVSDVASASQPARR